MREGHPKALVELNHTRVGKGKSDVMHVRHLPHNLVASFVQTPEHLDKVFKVQVFGDFRRETQIGEHFRHVVVIFSVAVVVLLLARSGEHGLRWGLRNRGGLLWEGTPVELEEILSRRGDGFGRLQRPSFHH